MFSTSKILIIGDWEGTDEQKMKLESIRDQMSEYGVTFYTPEEAIEHEIDECKNVINLSSVPWKQVDANNPTSIPRIKPKPLTRIRGSKFTPKKKKRKKRVKKKRK